MEGLLAGRYEIKARIGFGGMGEVYLAYDTKFEVERAIKIVRADSEEKRAASIVRLKREAQASAQLGTNSNVVMVYEFIKAYDNVPDCIVMELVQGESLSTILERETRLPMERALTLVHGICAGVGAAHRKKIVHRDLNPKNVIISQTHEGEVPKVIDFGLAKLPDARMGGDWTALTQVGTVMGTLAYMPPEQWEDASGVDCRADVYSLGIMLYEILVGELPFNVTGTEQLGRGELRDKHLNETPPSFPRYLQIPSELEKVVRRALAKKPSERPKDADELSGELVRALAKVAASNEKRKEEKRKKQEQAIRRKAQTEIEKLKNETEKQRAATEEAESKLRAVEGQKRLVESDVEGLRLELERAYLALELEKERQQAENSKQRREPEQIRHEAVGKQISIQARSERSASNLKMRMAVPSLVAFLLGVSTYVLAINWEWTPNFTLLSIGSIVAVGYLGLCLKYWMLKPENMQLSVFRVVRQVFESAISGFMTAMLLFFGLITASDSLVMKGAAYRDNRSYDAAIATYNRAVILNPRNPHAHFNRGLAYHYKNEYDAAITDYDEALYLSPNNQWIYLNRGIAQLSKKNYDKAISDLTDALRIDSKLSSAFMNRGVAYYGKKDYKSAVADYNQAIQIDPNNPIVYIHRSIAYHTTNENDKAKADLVRAEELKKGN